jgi:hypothetical protein
VKMMKPHPVTRDPRLAAVMIAAIMVAAGAIHPAMSSNIHLPGRVAVAAEVPEAQRS